MVIFVTYTPGVVLSVRLFFVCFVSVVLTDDFWMANVRTIFFNWLGFSVVVFFSTIGW